MPEQHIYPSKLWSYRKPYLIGLARGVRLKTPVEPYRDRLRALARAGWTSAQIAAAMDSFPSNVRTWQGAPAGKLIHRDTAARILAVYRQLMWQAGPSRATAMRAASRDWPTLDDIQYGPLTGADQVDQVAIDRALLGHPVPLTSAELTTAVTTSPLAHKRTARELGMSERHVLRILQREGGTAA